MRMVDIIEKKRDGFELTEEEIDFVISGYVKGTIPDYQISPWLMAIYFKNMTDRESSYLTKAMLYSGDVIDLTGIKGIKVDKHSTGGVGDKTTLVLAPLVASMGAKIAKLSGRGLGHTGGTLDKLESIDGCRIDLSETAFIDQVNRIGIAVAGQTATLVPADKLLYALRDVTGTVPSIPLIASSIMSKKLASGADVICLDVKVGDGAFMKTTEDARTLSRLMVEIGKSFGKKVYAFLTGMEEPLGLAIGNRLEVREAIDTLSGKGPADLEELCVAIASYMAYSAKAAKTVEEGKILAHENLYNGKALAKFYEFINAQGGHIDDLETFVKPEGIMPYVSRKSGYVQKILAHNIGLASMMLGGGRAKKEDSIDPMVGIVLKKKIGEKVEKGDVLANIYYDKPVSGEVMEELATAFQISEEPVNSPKVIMEIIGKE
ncbi:MAG TPA: pyrimidine-nucleoside phosphorylase [Bacillota bacterium]|nr:pyrimidine-nucleoside phosphorylase [Bacillota bacterium]HPF42425.1 pyrimidine-nucleoside phosphorylase [Bacillota bacterium]HPJ85442.1 pyrimidine-nucleoside phosphorylase [Bacillota bacterium]HPQ61262.1 pyrimidine-nucleoside phosphorylase [Bacillota bacterium]HRX91660.1 pyrimidine-nucleoside phosphorylase [Candidatus Izemoplasmatales bacterium]